MKKCKITCKKIYLVYVAVLLVLMIAAVIYVNNLLKRYEATIPEALVENAMVQLQQTAQEGNFWTQYEMPQVQPGALEEGRDVQKEYLGLYASENLKYAQKKGDYSEDELVYTIQKDGKVLAEVFMKAEGPAETKLAILTMRDWVTTAVKPVLEPMDYTVTLPEDFTIAVNGTTLTAEDGEKNQEGEVTYQLPGLYLEPQLQICSQENEQVLYSIEKNRIVAEYYDYRLNLPEVLTLKVDGQVQQGVEAASGYCGYRIRQLTKPELVLEDAFGNSVAYKGGKDLPLTHVRVLADDRWKVQVAGAEVPKSLISAKENPEYNVLKDYVEKLPQIQQYEIVILQENAEVSVTDLEGKQTVLDTTRLVHDMTKVAGKQGVPAELTEQVDVLARAQDWSLFMSGDLPFAQLEQYLIKNSYQYEVARKYSRGIDITFISDHVLLEPVFTENVVTGYMPISENAFSVDISFVKHMKLRTGKLVDDPMNDRFFFVKYDDSQDGVDNPTWKIAGMKEIIKND